MTTTDTTTAMEKETQLRLEAENRLKSGSFPNVPDSWTMGPDALSTLYRLASSHDSAADALKLLHELKVHQVELGLQHEQMVAAEQDMEESLAQSRDFYEWAPLAYFAVAWDGAVVDVNRAGVNLLGVSRQAAVGRNFVWFLSTESRAAVQHLITSLHGQNDGAHCEVRFNQSGLAGQINASVPPGGDVVLMMVSQVQGSREV